MPLNISFTQKCFSWKFSRQVVASAIAPAVVTLAVLSFANASPPAENALSTPSQQVQLVSDDVSDLSAAGAMQKLTDTAQQADSASKPVANEHPLTRAIAWAKECLPKLGEVADYSATLVKREQVDGALGSPQTLFVKVRHKPFSVYTRVLEPESIKGQEAIYIDGQNSGKLWAHAGGSHGKFMHTYSLKPDGMIAMHGQRYPITEIGLLSMVKHLIADGEQDSRHNDCQVKYFTGAKLNGRNCIWFEVVHPEPRDYYKYHLARIYVDEQSKFPVRFEAYAWPTTPNGQPPLIEEYTYLNLKVNNGFSDRDFSIANREYRFH